MLRKQLAEIIEDIITSATPEELDYILRKVSKSRAAMKAAKKAKKAAGQAKKAAKKAKNFMFGGDDVKHYLNLSPSEKFKYLKGTASSIPVSGYSPTASSVPLSGKVKGAFNLNNLKIGPKTFPGDPDTKAIKKAQEGLAAIGVSGLAGAGIYANTKRLQNQKEETGFYAKLKKLNPIK